MFDYETDNSFRFVVVAKDKGDPQLSSSTNIHVAITDTNDHSPKFNQSTYEFWITENVPNGTNVGFVSATDKDSYPFATFQYTLSQTDAFVIDSITGHLTTSKQLDRELNPVYFLNVYATNTEGSTPLRGEAVVIIKLRDQNDNWPTITYPHDNNKTVFVSTDVPQGYEIIHIEATDLDIGSNAELTYSLTGGQNQDLFVVDYITGMISTSKRLKDYDEQILEIVVGVSDKGIPNAHMSTALLEIRVNSSVPFYNVGVSSSKDDDLLLQGTHLNIVIALAVVSAIIVVILVVAIVLVKRQDRNKRQALSRQRIEGFRIWANGTPPQSKEDDLYSAVDREANGNALQAHLAATQVRHRIKSLFSKHLTNFQRFLNKSL